MSWGLPPKWTEVHQFNNGETVDTINQSVLKALRSEGYEILEKGHYMIAARKVLGLNLLGVLMFAKPKIRLTILITKSGKLTINSVYDYESYTSMAFNDMGKQKRFVTQLLKEIINIV